MGIQQKIEAAATGETPGAAADVFHLVLIKPTHYDDDGYPIQWFRSAIPSNTLACLYGLGEDAHRRQVLGPEHRTPPAHLSMKPICGCGPTASSACCANPAAAP